MSIGVILLSALVLGSVVFAAHWSRSDMQNRKSGAFVFAIVWILFWSVAFPRIIRMDRYNNATHQQYDAWHVPILVDPSVLSPSSPRPQADPRPIESRSTELAVAENSPAPKQPATTAPVTTELSKAPDWLHQAPTRQGDIYVVPVASGAYTDPNIREQMLEAKIAAAANRYIDEILYRQGGVADNIALEPEYLQTFVRARATSPESNETFVRLEFDQHFRSEVDRRYKQLASFDRLKLLGAGSAAAVTLLGAVYCYLRFSQPRKPATAASAQASA